MADKKIVLATIKDLVSDFLYYDRKEDEELSADDLEGMIKNGEITVEEIIGEFEAELRERLQ